jgi:hypothetical protein
MSRVPTLLDPQAASLALQAVELPFTQTVETSDWGLAYTKAMDQALPPLGVYLATRVVSATVAVPDFTGGMLGVNRNDAPFGVWVEEIFCDFDTAFSLGSTDVAQQIANGIAVLAPQPYLISDGRDSMPARNAGGFNVRANLITGRSNGAFTTNLAFVLANNGLRSRIGGPLWIPPQTNPGFDNRLEWVRNTANTAWSGTVAIRWIAPRPEQ